MTLTIIIPEWFGWIGVFFVGFYMVFTAYDNYRARQDRKDFDRRQNNG